MYEGPQARAPTNRFRMCSEQPAVHPAALERCVIVDAGAADHLGAAVGSVRIPPRSTRGSTVEVLGGRRPTRSGQLPRPESQASVCLRANPRLTHNTSVCSMDHFQNSIIAVEVEAALGGEPIAVATDIGPRDVRVGGSPEDGRCPHHGNTTSSASRFSAVYNDGRNRERYLNSVWACCISCRPITSGMMLGSSSGGRPVSA